MSLKKGALARAEQIATVTRPLALEKRRHELGYDQLQELDQQYQIQVKGSAGATAVFTTKDLLFEVDFFDAPEQRDASLAVPLFTFGVFCPVDIFATAVVRAWNEDDRGALIGATVSLGACVPGAAAAVDFEAIYHLNFQGFGALSENIEQLDVGT